MSVRLFAPKLAVVSFAIASLMLSPAQAELQAASGKVTFLRVHDVGTRYGPPSDQLDVEVVVQLNSKPGQAFGFKLRDDNDRPVRQGMLDLLRDAYANNSTVSIDFNINPPKKNGVIIRVALTKP